MQQRHGMTTADRLTALVREHPVRDGRTDPPRLRDSGVGAHFWSVYVRFRLRSREVRVHPEMAP